MNPEKLILLFSLVLLLSACGSDSDGVPSLAATPTPIIEEVPLDNEDAVMAFVQCMREEGIEFKDPEIDADGNIKKPQFVDGFSYTRKELAGPYVVCSHHIEGLSLGRKRGDITERVDKFVAIAICLNEKGYDVDEPTTETIGQWLIDFRTGFDWDDTDAQVAYEDCSNNENDGLQR